MYLTQKEILSQYTALRKTFEYIQSRAEEILVFVERHDVSSISFTGCGSSYCLAKSGEISARIRLNVPAYSFASGDLMLNYSCYEKLLRDTLLVISSRSGGTSEVLNVAFRAKQQDIPMVAICAKEDSELSYLAGLTLEIPWAFDESVCQTRTVSNLYAVQLMLIGLLGRDQSLLAEIEEAIVTGEGFIRESQELLAGIGQTDFRDVVILADSELEGIASEASLAFIEIPQVFSRYYHVLDVRHGPMVLINDQTLVIVACSPFDTKYQQQLIRDLRARGAKVLTVSTNPRDYDGDWNVGVPAYSNFAVLGMPFIAAAQLIALYKALAKGVNPDKPDGLAPFIRL